MAITSGIGPHYAWLNISGCQIPILNGTVTQSAKRKTARFHCDIPLSYPGAFDTLANVGGDAEATITVLTRSMTGQLIVGHIQDVDIDPIARVIRVSGADKSYKLHNIKSSEQWLNKKTTEIVKDLVGRVGLTANITAPGVMAGKQLQQDFVKLSDNVSYSYVIHKLAELDGARWWVDANGVFNYVPLGSPTGIYSIKIDQDAQPISSDCLHLSVKRNLEAAKNIQVSVKAWHPHKKQVFAYTANIPGNGGPVTYSYHFPTLLQDNTQQYAKSHANEHARHELTVTATVVGDPSVQAGMGLSLSGTKYFDQTYDMDTVLHNFGKRGHTTHVTARGARAGRTAS